MAEKKISRRGLLKFIPAMGIGAVLGKEIVANPPRVLSAPTLVLEDRVIAPFASTIPYSYPMATTTYTSNTWAEPIVWYSIRESSGEFVNS